MKLATIGIVARRFAETLRGIVSTYRVFGAQSARVFADTAAINLVAAVENRFLGARVECPCCGWRGHRFRSLNCGKFRVPDVQCPNCGGHERHRMIHLFLTRRPPEFFAGKGWVLHFAPEAQVRNFVAARPDLHYLATDIEPRFYEGQVGFACDIHHAPIAENSLAGLFCLHVLEHVVDDRASIRELHRILRPGGEAVLMVPFMMHQTETEEYGKADPEIFGHMRGYSPLDFKDRLAPFTYEQIRPETLLSPDEIRRYCVPDSQHIYLCRK